MNILDVAETKVEDLAPLKNLTQLTYLDVAKTKIEDLAPLKNLTQLEILDVTRTKVKDLNPLKRLIINGVPTTWEGYTFIEYNWVFKGKWKIINLTCKITQPGIKVENCPLTIPPVDIAKQGAEAVLNYFQQLEEQDTKPLYESKLIIVGEPQAGKTSLAKKIVDPNYEIPQKEEQTIGIDIHEGWSFRYAKENDIDFKVNIWDFGGQIIQYMTHQFFLTPSALYVLVANDRKQNTNFPYWFEIIHLLGKEGSTQSPILVVLNEHHDSNITNYDHNQYRKKYPETDLQVKAVNLAKKGDLRFDQLRNLIQEKLCTLPHVGDRLPASWPQIRRALREEDSDYITENEFFGICEKNGLIGEANQRNLSSYLHKLGIILHFQQDESLIDFVILNPQWAVDAVYYVLRDKEVNAKQGFFTKTMVNQIWSKYKEKERLKLLWMMKKNNFEICYEVAPEKYLAPQLLKNIQPTYPWQHLAGLQFVYRYRFMPPGILTRMIVRTHEHIAVEGERSLVWEKGVVLEKNGCRAQIIEQDYPDQKMAIHVVGPKNEQKYVLRWVGEELETVHRRWFSDIRYERYLPCICEDCRKDPKADFFKYSAISKHLDKGRTKVYCDSYSNEVNLLDLLGEFFYVKQEIVAKGGIMGEISALKGLIRDRFDWQDEKLESIDRKQDEQLTQLSVIFFYTSEQRKEWSIIQEMLKSNQEDQSKLQPLLEDIRANIKQLENDLPLELVEKLARVEEEKALETNANLKAEFTIAVIPGLLSYKIETDWDIKSYFTQIWKDLKNGHVFTKSYKKPTLKKSR